MLNHLFFSLLPSRKKFLPALLGHYKTLITLATAFTNGMLVIRLLLNFIKYSEQPATKVALIGVFFV